MKIDDLRDELALEITKINLSRCNHLLEVSTGRCYALDGTKG